MHFLGRFSLLLLLWVAAPAHAKWLEASSGHFVVYADDDPKNVRRLSEQLEQFHGAMTRVLRVEAPVPSPSNRVTVYVVRSDAQVRKLAGDKTGFVYGFYVPRAGGSLAVVPTVDAGNGELAFSMIALLHEYAHHVTLTNTSIALPAWMVEGAAEFFSSAKFNKDGSIEIGRPAMHRGGELYFAKNVGIDDLLEPDMAQRERQKTFDNFYGRSWLLYHYLTFDKKRAGQLARYAGLFNQGKGSIEAAKEAFGDLRQLDKELDEYLGARMVELKLPPAPLAPDAVKVRELSVGEAAMMPVRIRSKRGVNREQALALLPEARKVAAAYLGDAAVLSALSEAEHDAGNYDQSIAAADAALAIDPRQANAFVQKGYSLFEKARETKDAAAKAAAYVTARKPFLELNQIENDHPLPLFFYYLSFTEQDKKPSENAVAALNRAVDLAPFDLRLRMTRAVQELRDDQKQQALRDLRPIAYDPHSGAFAQSVRGLIGRIEAGATKDELFKNGKLDLGGEDNRDDKAVSQN